MSGTLRSSFLFSANGPALRSLRNVTPSPNLLIEPSDRLFYALDAYGHRSTPHLSKHHCSLGVKVGSETPCHKGLVPFARSLPQCRRSVAPFTDFLATDIPRQELSKLVRRLLMLLSRTQYCDHRLALALSELRLYTVPLLRHRRSRLSATDALGVSPDLRFSVYTIQYRTPHHPMIGLCVKRSFYVGIRRLGISFGASNDNFVLQSCLFLLLSRGNLFV